MLKFILGVLFGIVLSSVGFAGIAQLLDNSIDKVKETVQEQVKHGP